MQKAEKYVSLKRQAKGLEDEAAEVKRDAAALHDELLAHIEAGEFPESSRVLGATVFLRSQVWAGPKNKDHAALAAVLFDLGLLDFLPKTVNTNTLSGYVREQLDDDTTKAIEDRLHTLDPKLSDALNVTEKFEVRVNGL